MRRRQLSRKGWGVLLIGLAIYFLITAISDTVNYYNTVEDYNSLTPTTAYDGKLVDGTIEECDGPVGHAKGGIDIYLLKLDNGNYIPFITYDDEMNDMLEAYNENSEISEGIDFAGKTEKMTEKEEAVILDGLINSGYITEGREELLIPYFLIEQKNDSNKYNYMLALVFGALGFLFFLPEFGNFIGRTGKKEPGEPSYHVTNTRYAYNTPHSGVPNSYANNQPVQQKPQNRAYIGNQYPPQGQNRAYTGSQYSSKDQNSGYTGSQYSPQGQNRDYSYNQTDDFKSWR